MITTLVYSLFALDQTLSQLAAQYGPWLYAILFAIIFAETGLVVLPFLPGDSILFISGTVVAVAGLNVHVLVVVLIVAAILGDSVNYGVGHYMGPKVFHEPDSGWFKRAYLERTQAFYTRYGGVTIIIGRFVPIIRTFAPFRLAWPACRTRASSATTSSARSRGSRRSCMPAISSATSHGSRSTSRGSSWRSSSCRCCRRSRPS